MSLPVFLHPDLSHVQPGQPVGLEGPEARHAVTVKRIQAGEQVVLADPTGLTATITVTDTPAKDALIGTVDELAQAPEPSPRVVVVQAIPKSERAELAVDLATQAGADEIIAWQAQRCIAKWEGKKVDKALAKWQSAAAAAAKQSRRPRIPVVSGPLTTGQLAQKLAGEDHAQAFVLHEDATDNLKNVPLEEETIYLIIGPEGGIGDDELAKLTAAGARAIKLGPEVLRTAAAAMVALAVIGARTQRW